MNRHSGLNVLSLARHRLTLRHFCTLAVGVLLLSPTRAYSQSIVDPTTAEFNPSADHNVTVSGAPVVDHYEIGFYLIAAAQPIQINQLGKPSPGADGKIRINLGARPSSGIVYEARASAVGSGGTGISAASNAFTFSSPCSYSVSPTTQVIVPGGSAASVTLSSTSGCAWSATESLNWVTITSGASGTGSGIVNYTVTANTSTTSRMGTLTVAGQPVTITQSGMCSFAVSPTTQAMAAGGDVAIIAITTTSGCAWSATESLAWVTITSGGSGTGSGTLSYSVPANMSTAPRTGTLTVGGKAIMITQEGSSGAPAAPSNLHIISRAEQGASYGDEWGGIRGVAVVV